MDDVFAGLLKAVVWVFVQIGIGIGAGVQRLILALFGMSRPGKTPPTPPSDDEETKRLAGCRETVLFYANHMGYIARECITKEELDEKITAGIQPYELAHEIEERMKEKPGVMLGYHSRINGVEIKQPDSWRERHTYIIGKSGSGKTNLLRGMITQDMAQGNGIRVLAPEQEFLTEEILPFIPQERISDVVYFNPADTEYPIPINPLHLEEGEDIDLAVDENLTIFKRLMGDTQARMEELLRQSLYALLERKGSTLLDIERLLSREDPSLRQEIIRTSQDEQTIRFFRDTYTHYPKDAHLPITTRIGRLVRPRAIRTLLCQPGRSFSFRDAMDEGRILLFNLSDGLLGEQTSQLLGQLIVSKIQMAVMSRVDIAATARRPFYLYLDEFQTFTGIAQTSYEKLLSRARKYKLSLILAHQQTGQLSDDLLREILGNVSTILSFTVAAQDARQLSREFVMDQGAEIESIPPEALLRLKVGEAIGKIGKSVFPFQTTLVTARPNPLLAKEVIERSRLNYGSAGAKNAPPKNDAKNPNSSPDNDIDPSEVF